jgi:hypothetical protein
MFTTVDDVWTITGYEVDENILAQAQAIVESFVGRLEVEVTNAVDLMILGRATAYQAAYISNNPGRIFEQAAVSQIGQFGQLVTFRSDDEASPFVAPLAKLACKKLSWKRMRSVKTGSIYGQPPEPDTWVTT